MAADRNLLAAGCSLLSDLVRVQGRVPKPRVGHRSRKKRWARTTRVRRKNACVCVCFPSRCMHATLCGVGLGRRLLHHSGSHCIELAPSSTSGGPGQVYLNLADFGRSWWMPGRIRSNVVEFGDKSFQHTAPNSADSGPHWALWVYAVGICRPKSNESGRIWIRFG